MTAPTSRYALVIGNSHYSDEAFQQLITPASDAEALSLVLENRDIGHFHVRTKLNRESGELNQVIEEFFTAAERKNSDTLLFYFSGHGVIGDNGELRLAVVNTAKKVLNSTSISARSIREYIHRSYAGIKIIILDCCFSGAIADERLFKGSPEARVSPQFSEGLGRGVVFVSASTAFQYALQGDSFEELDGSPSLFTRFLVRGLETGEADLDQDGEISVRELYDYASNLVREATENQTPEISEIGRSGKIIIAKSVRPQGLKQNIGRDVRFGDQAHPLDEGDGHLLERVYQQALTHYKAEEWVKAIDWFKILNLKVDKYKNTDVLLDDAKRQLRLATFYNDGLDALEREDWETAQEKFRQVREINPGYRVVNDLYNQAYTELKLPQLYAHVQEQLHEKNWDGAIETLEQIRTLRPGYESTASLLEEAWDKKRLQDEHKQAFQQYKTAKRTEQEQDWRDANHKLMALAEKGASYEFVGFRSQLDFSKRRVEYFDCFNEGKTQFESKQWQEASRLLEHAKNLGPSNQELDHLLAQAKHKLHEENEAKHRRMLDLYDRGMDEYLRRNWKQALAYFQEASAIESNYDDLPNKLAETKREVRRQTITRWLWGTASVILTLLLALFANPIAKWGESILSSTTAPYIAEVELYSDDRLIKSGQTKKLAAGTAMTLKVTAIGSDGVEYRHHGLICHWTVEPLGSQDITTQDCITLFEPEVGVNYAVSVEVFGKEGQFQSSASASIMFEVEQ